jgi:hypothetical protein
MKHLWHSVIVLALLASSGCKSSSDETVVCGDDMVLIIDNKASDSTDVKVNWSWKVSEASDLPADYQKLMIPTDECKPVNGGRSILITSSGGGAVLVDRDTKKTLFYARVPMAHSAEMMPGNRIVVALSTAEGGNSIELYNAGEPERILFRDSLYSGHGVVWMEKMRKLLALGFDELRSYSLQDWDTDKPELKLEKTWKLPDESGHDLVFVNDNTLLITTHHNVWLFDTKKENFRPFSMLDGTDNVKSVNYNEQTGELIYTKAEESWWTHNIYFRDPDKIVTLPDLKIYKVRKIRN